MLFTLGFLTTFIFGGLTGVILSTPVVDFHIQDTYFVVAHFHYVMAGTVVFGMFAGFYFWWPKMFGHKLSEKIGSASCRERADIVAVEGSQKTRTARP